MELIQKEKFNILKASEGMHLRNIDDEYKQAYVDENSNEIEEHFPYYFPECYLPKSITLEEANNIYIEEPISKEVQGDTV